MLVRIGKCRYGPVGSAVDTAVLYMIDCQATQRFAIQSLTCASAIECSSNPALSGPCEGPNTKFNAMPKILKPTKNRWVRDLYMFENFERSRVLHFGENEAIRGLYLSWFGNATCEVSMWQNKGECTVSCGGGQQLQTRSDALPIQKL